MKKVGLALSGGGALGLAHVGVIKTLVENNIPIDYISGTSIGALVGGLYAATKDVKVLEEIALDYNWKELFNLFFDPGLKGGLIKGNKIINLIEKYTGKIDFHDLKIPFTAVATDFNTGEKVEISNGSLCKAIRASIAVPVFFQAEEINNQILFDGGLSSPYPVSTVKKMGAEIIVGVNLYDNYLSEFKSKDIGFFPLLWQSLKIYLHNISKEEAKLADVNISPQSTKIGWKKLMSKSGSQEGIDLGILAAQQEIKSIQYLLKTRKLGLFDRLLHFFKIR